MAAIDKRLRYPIPAADFLNPHCAQIIVRKSRFLAQACQADSAAMSRKFVDQVRGRHPDATHNCWAFIAGAPGNTAFIGSSDDGEPHGTAGRPMLQSLLHCGIGQICVVVSRWFGGIKLGTGGLARAYQDAVAENLKSLPLVTAVPRSRWKAVVEYADLPAIRRLLAGFEVEIEAEEYGNAASLILSAPQDRDTELVMALANASNGNVKLVEECAAQSHP